MIQLTWRTTIALYLVGSSLVLAIIHLIIFRDATTLFFYLALDIVFVPVQVLLVTFIIERTLSEREKQALMTKLNMVIGAFFSEVGHKLIRQMGQNCIGFKEFEKQLSIDMGWGKEEYGSAIQFVGSFECKFDPHHTELQKLRDYLVSKRSFVLGLLQNPSLLEHDTFTDLLWAVCHLTEELESRADFSVLPSSDLLHLEVDIRRAFGNLVREWLLYMQHLKKHYPYIYSLSVRLNPFNPGASPVVK